LVVAVLAVVAVVAVVVVVVVVSRAGMRPGWPVHLGGLRGRADLNSKAGLLKELCEQKGRWALLVGDETVLVKPENLFP